MTSPRALLAAVLVLCSPLVASQTGIYKSRDAQGNVIFSDQAGDASQPVTLPPTNTMQGVTPAPAPAQPAAPSAAAYDTLTIASPTDGQSVFSAAGSLDVSIRISPALHAEHTLQVLLDGAPAGFAQDGTLTLEGLSRGSHSLQAQVLDADGRVVQSSSTISVQLQRTVIRQLPMQRAVPLPR